MPAKVHMPFLSSLAGEIDKLTYEIEEEAKNIVQKEIADARMRKDEVMARARESLNTRREMLSDVQGQLDAVDAALGGNSGDRKNPT